ncbi:uncharacterized protein [Euphorbia lathyris]|uniref:uncharacterized protein n=1 Tax=Euphorbia lathyris TaxID=212925 RepID=UPI003313D7E3
MARATKILQRCRKAVEDLDLRNLLESEINHERSSPLLGNQSGSVREFLLNQRGSLGEFVAYWDSFKSQDVVLRRHCESGEEVAVSALLDPSRNGLFKVCVKKPGLNSILQFDCGFYANGNTVSQIDIHSVSYLQSIACPNPSAYIFRALHPDLQTALREYLVAKGISESLVNFLHQHLSEKEQGQYLNWLKKLQSLTTEGK